LPVVGLGWTMHFGRVLIKTTMANGLCGINRTFVSTLKNPVLELPDGSLQTLVYTDKGTPLMLSPQLWRVDCNSQGSHPIVYSPDGVRYDMSHRTPVGSGNVTAWYTTRITDRNGNSATVTYDSGRYSTEIASVKASDGRQIDFNYESFGTGYHRLRSITGAGKTYTYSYTTSTIRNGVSFLVSARRPDGLEWKYTYNGNMGLNKAGSHLINSVTSPHGGTTSYSYEMVQFDAGAAKTDAVSSKRTSLGTWSFGYTPGKGNSYDSTTVSMSNGTRINYRHIGVNSVGYGTVWKVGLLVSKSISGNGSQEERYSWTDMLVSSQNYCRPAGCEVNRIDTDTRFPLLLRRTITRNGIDYSTNYSNFDGYGNPRKITESGVNGGSRTTTLSYYTNASKWIIHQVEDESASPGRDIRRSFGSSGNLISESIDGITTRYTYDSAGNVASVTRPRGLTTRYSNYYRGIARSESQPEGVSISRDVSSAGNITSVNDGEGRTTRYGYDSMNRLTRISRPAGNTTTISYGRTSRTTTRGDLTETVSYNSYGMPTGVTLGGIRRSFSVDALGRRTFESNPGGSGGTHFSYDALDRLTRITYADGSSQDISYGGGSKRVKDERGYVTTYHYRAYGDPDRQYLIRIDAPAGASMSISRNGADLVTRIAQGERERTYGYDSSNYLVSATHPETGRTTYTRDSAGNMTSRTVGEQTTSYTYDGQNRLVETVWPDGFKSTQEYSRTHRIKRALASPQWRIRTYEYDDNDNLVAETLLVDGHALKVGYAYNDNDQLTALTYPVSGNVVEYAPDALGRPTQVSGYADAVTWWDSGQVSQIAYRNGVRTDYAQDGARLWPTGFASARPDGAFHNDAVYEYDRAGNLTRIDERVDARFSRELDYDGVNRLTRADAPGWGAGRIDYDGTGNIVHQEYGADFSMDYTYDDNNRLSGVRGARTGEIAYDEAGNVLSSPGFTYTWDGAHNLKKVCEAVSSPKPKRAGAGNCTEHYYDGQNQRIIRVDQANVRTYEVYGAQGNLLAEYQPGEGHRLTEYIYLGGKRIAQNELDGVPAPVGSLPPDLVDDSLPPPAPTLTLERTPRPMVAGQDHHFVWNTANATRLIYTCTAQGTGFRESRELPLAGDHYSPTYAQWIGYPSTCVYTASGPGGSITVTEILETVHYPPDQ
jgi:YD repeat-containing protein